MPDIEARSADGKSHFFPTGTDQTVIDRVMKEYAQAHPVAPARNEVVDAVPRGFFKGTIGTFAEFARAGQLEDEQRALAFNIPGSKPMPEIPTGEEAIKFFNKASRQNRFGLRPEDQLPPEPKGRAGRFAEAGVSALANPLSYIGPGGWSKPVAAVTSSLAAEGGGQFFADTAFEVPARFLFGLVGGAGPAWVSSERNLKNLGSRLPVNSRIEAAADNGYEWLKQNGAKISPAAGVELQGEIEAQMHTDLFRPTLEPKTFQALEELSKDATSIGSIDTTRRLLGRIAKNHPEEREAANRAIRAIDDYLMNIPDHYVLSGNPALDAEVLRFSQRNWAIHKQLDLIEEASTKAQHRAGVAGTGGNRINTARQEIRKILDSDQKSRGMSEAVKEQMEKIIVGTWLTNTSRRAGKFAPEGPVSAIPTMAAAATGGIDAGVSLAAGGFLSRWLAEYLTDRQLRQLEEMIRAESPIGRPIAREIAPLKREQEIVPAAQAARSALTSPLAPGQ